MKNLITDSGSREHIRPSGLLLMMLFTFCSIALMWTAVDCFKRISGTYEGASEGMAAAQFISNKLRSAADTVSIELDGDGTLEKMTIPLGSGCSDIITFTGSSLREATVFDGVDSPGDEVFGVKSVHLSGTDVEGVYRITVYVNGGCYTASAAAGSDVLLLSDGREAAGQ